MIVLLSCSINSLANSNSTLSSTGGVSEDSILVSYDDLRKANAKLVELEYEKDINKKLNNIIANDSISISVLRNNIDRITRESREQIRRAKRERNTLGGISIVSIILLVISLL